MPVAGGLAVALEGRLAEVFKKAGWKASSRAPDCDLVVSKNALTYVVEIRVWRDGRRPLLEAFLADALLRADALARERGARGLAIVGASNLSERMAEALRNYVARFRPKAAFGLIDSLGRLELHGEGLKGLGQSPQRPVRRSRQPAASHDIFSDLNQWLLKVMLGRFLPSDFLNVPRGDIAGAASLAALGNVSVPSAWRLLEALKLGGFVDLSSTGIEIVRREELLTAWRAAVARPSEEVRARFLLPNSDSLRTLDDSMRRYRARYPQSPRGRRICWAGFAAVSWLRYEFVRGVPLEVYLEQPDDEALELLGLQRVHEQERTDVVLMRPRWPEAVFRAALPRNGQPSADIIQCWLDVSKHPARGKEQAEMLWSRVLGPAFLTQTKPTGRKGQ